MSLFTRLLRGGKALLEDISTSVKPVIEAEIIDGYLDPQDVYKMAIEGSANGPPTLLGPEIRRYLRDKDDRYDILMKMAQGDTKELVKFHKWVPWAPFVNMNADHMTLYEEEAQNVLEYVMREIPRYMGEFDEAKLTEMIKKDARGRIWNKLKVPVAVGGALGAAGLGTAIAVPIIVKKKKMSGKE